MKRFLLILMVFVMLLSVCSCKKETGAPDNDDVGMETVDSSVTPSDSEPEADETKPFEQYEEETNEISTPYGPLSYPAEWQDIVTVETTEGETGYAVKFTANLDSKSIPLYTLVFGESATGYALGKLATDDGTVTVYCEDYTAEQDGQLSEPSKGTYNNLCMGLNHIISSLIYDSGMVVD